MKYRTTYVAILVLALLSLAGCSILPAGNARQASSSQSQAEPTPIPTPIVPTKPTYTVQRGDVQKKLEFTGRIAPVKEQELFFKTSGRVRQVLAKRNDLVKQGQLLADLEIEDLERQQQAAELEVERAKQNFADAERELANNLKRAQINLDIAKGALASLQRRDMAPEKVQAQADLRSAEIALKQAQEAYDAIAWRNDASSTGAAADLEQATLNFERAKAAFDMAQQGIDQHKYDVAAQQRQVQLAQLSLDELGTDVNPLLQNDVQRAELSLVNVKAEITKAQIVAPFDGKVLSIALTEGRAVDAFNPVVTVADPAQLEVSADLQSTDLQQLAENLPVSLMLVSRPGEKYQGIIRKLPYPYGSGGGSTKLDELDKSTRVTLQGDLSNSGIELGDLMRATVILEDRPNVLWLPPQAVRTFQGRNFVVVQDANGQRRVDVKIGVKSDDRVEILEGLTEGLVIVGN